jgi:general secretion pathway protein G
MRRNRDRAASGFTLVELMVVIVILGLLASLVGTNVVRHISRAKITTAKTQIKMLDQAVIDFWMDTGQYPDNSIGLDALVEQPPGVDRWDKDGYLKEPVVPLDPWGNDYIYYLYSSPGESGKYDIYSMGPDGKEDTEDDIYSTEIAEEDYEEN